MWKLSMKKLGTPASGDASASGSDGVSVDGDGARWPARPAAEGRASPAPLASPPGAVLDSACAWPAAGEPPAAEPCERWACTSGGAASGPLAARRGLGALALPRSPRASAGTSGSGVVTVPSAGGLDAVLIVEASLARLLAGRASATAPRARSGRRDSVLAGSSRHSFPSR